MRASGELTRIVAGERVFELLSDRTNDPSELKITIRADDAQWTFDEPSWRPLFYGFGDHHVYVWSARRVILLPASPGSVPETIETDEDLFYAFEIPNGFILVCELSVRLIAAGQETSRISFGEVILRATLRGSSLTLQDFDGNEIKVTISDSGLTLGADSVPRAD